MKPARTRRLGCAALIALAALAAAQGTQAKSKAEKPPSASSALAQTAQANNQFAFDLYKQLSAAQQGKNLFLSPASISTALAMTLEGAGGKTRQEMAQTLRLPMDEATRREGYAQLLQALNGAPDKGYKLSIANALWGQSGFPLLPSYPETIHKYYDGDFRRVVFPSPAVEAINQWVAAKTENKILDLIHKDDVNERTRLVLTNAIYFKGDWQSPFEEVATRKEPFHTLNGAAVATPMMRQTAHFAYARGKGYAAVELPYKGGDLSLLVLLPEAGVKKGLQKLEAQLSAESIAHLLESMQSEDVDLALPRFTLKDRTLLADPLKQLGMREAFDQRRADFSGITGRKDLYITSVIHQTYIDVNERGSEAAAATGVIMGLKASFQPAPPIVFHANRPFVYLIVHRQTGAILFLGRMTQPGS